MFFFVVRVESVDCSEIEIIEMRLNILFLAAFLEEITFQEAEDEP